MSLRSQASYTVPEETARVAHAIFPKGNVYLRLADTLVVYFKTRTLPNSSPWMGSPRSRPSG